MLKLPYIPHDVNYCLIRAWEKLFFPPDFKFWPSALPVHHSTHSKSHFLVIRSAAMVCKHLVHLPSQFLPFEILISSVSLVGLAPADNHSIGNSDIPNGPYGSRALSTITLSTKICAGSSTLPSIDSVCSSNLLDDRLLGLTCSRPHCRSTARIRLRRIRWF